jgi:hypothetical protein
MNLTRRHLSVGQQAALGAEVEAYLSTFTKARQLSALERGNALRIMENLPEWENGGPQFVGEEAGRPS